MNKRARHIPSLRSPNNEILKFDRPKLRMIPSSEMQPTVEPTTPKEPKSADEGSVISVSGQKERQEMTSGIKVCLRLRPMNRLETSRRSRNCIDIHNGGKGMTVDSALDGAQFDFAFDKVGLYILKKYTKHPYDTNLH